MTSVTARRSCGAVDGSRPPDTQFAAVLEDIAADGLPSVENCSPWEELREAHLAQLVAQRPVVA